MLDFNLIIEKTLQNGNASDPKFRSLVYVRAEEALVNIANKQIEPDKYIQQWLPLLHEQIENIERRYYTAPNVVTTTELVEKNATDFIADPEPLVPPLPTPPLPDVPLIKNPNSQKGTSMRGKLIAALIAGLGLGVLGSYFYFSSSATQDSTSSKIVDLSVGDAISNTATLQLSSNVMTISDTSKAALQFRRWDAQNVIAQIPHDLVIKIAATEKATNSPRFLIVFGGKGAKKATYSYTMNLKLGKVTGTNLKDNAAKTMLLEDGYWVFKQKLTPNPKHKNVYVMIFPAFKGQKTGSITLKKLDLSLE